jgi:hypothetical protein
MMRVLAHIPELPLFLGVLFIGIGLGAAVLYYLFRQNSTPKHAAQSTARYLSYAVLLTALIAVFFVLGGSLAYSEFFQDIPILAALIRTSIEAIFAILTLPQNLIDTLYGSEHLWWSNGGFFMYVVIHVVYLALLLAVLFGLIQNLRKKWSTTQVRNFIARFTIAAAAVALGFGLGLSIIWEREDFLRETHFITHEFNAHLKNVCVEIAELGLCPKTEADLKSLNPGRYARLAEFYPTLYHYDEASKVHTWIVRDGDSLFIARPEFYPYGYAMYSLKGHQGSAEAFGAKPYPPELPGPWDQFP